MIDIEESYDNYFVPGPENARELATKQVIKTQGALVVPIYTLRSDLEKDVSGTIDIQQQREEK